MRRLAERLADHLEENGTIQNEDKALYSFGIYQGAFLLLNLITLLFIGYVFDMLWQGILFMLIYFPLRSFAGGYHASTQLRCYLFSVVSISIILNVMKYISWSVPLCIILSVISGAVIFMTAPVEDRNKPLDDLEIQVYRKRARYILLFETVIFFVFVFLKLEMLYVCITLAFVFAVFMLIAGKVKNKYVGIKT